MREQFRYLNSRALAMVMLMASCDPRGSTCPDDVQAELVSPERIRQHLECAVPETPWAKVPAQFQPWAQQQLEARLEIAVEHLTESYDPDAIETARDNMARLVEVIRLTAIERCNPKECEGRHLEPPPIEQEMHRDICPGLFPFC